MQLTTWQADNTRNKFQHVGTLKYNKVFTTRGHTCLTCRLCYQRIVHKYKCLLFLFFLLSLNWEGERICNCSTLLFDGFLRRVFSLLRAGGFIYIALAWRHRSSCPRFFPLLHPEFGTRFTPSVHHFISLQNWFSLSLFPLMEKGAISTLGF